MVALVGSRHCMSYGKRMAEKIAAGLARAGLTVVSGLARGIDGAAHRGALQAGGRTIAVLAGGLSRIFPPEHTDLAAQVAAAGGPLLETQKAPEPPPGVFSTRHPGIIGRFPTVVPSDAA